MPIVGRFGSLAGLGSLILPGGAMESIATISVGSGGASSIEFTSLPTGFQHLQVRFLVQQGSGSAFAGNIYTLLRLNSDSTAGNYPSHTLEGSGASATASAITGTSYSYAYVAQSYLDTGTSSVFAAGVIDLLDYGSTSKNKTIRCFNGWDANGSGVVSLHSAAWLSTSAVTSLALFPNVTSSRTFKQHTTAALYGIRS